MLPASNMDIHLKQLLSRLTVLKNKKSTRRKKSLLAPLFSPNFPPKKVHKLVRSHHNPIISPRPEYGWEAWQTFNPGVILLNGKTHFVYRAIGEDGLSRFGYAVSDDGFRISDRIPYAIYEHRLLESSVLNFYSFASGGSFGGCEDPRLVQVAGDENIYMTYTACDRGLSMAITSIKEEDFLKRRWRWKTPMIMSKPGEAHKNWVIFPEKINGKYAVLHSISPDISIAYRDNLEFADGEYIESHYDGYTRTKVRWDGWIRGAGAPPVKTDAGWLLFYHAMDLNDPGKYKVGVLLLDLDDPTKVISRAQEAVLEPEVDYENNGFKAGVVYVTGAVVRYSMIYVYYGASDSYTSVAYAKLNDFLCNLRHNQQPVLVTKVVEKQTT